MKPDPRALNRVFSPESPAHYLAEYATALAGALGTVSPTALAEAARVLEDATRAKRRIYVCGNGGSAAIADHLCCDWTKGTKVEGLPPLRTHSLAANGALLTALANDFGYEECFATQVDYFAEPGDVLVAISSSGKSPNILKAVARAKERGLKVIGLSGFSGGGLAQEADISLYVAFHNYGLVEDAHQSIMHVLSQYLTLRLEGRETPATL
jgi:phosphoheptose isomerase